ncbi:MAG: c-type cytochrome [Anaerolineales bacterium]|nr:MAG: c-type cytochrome [Anaerolineales bacterium]
MPASVRIRVIGSLILMGLVFLLASLRSVHAQAPSQDQLELGAQLYADNCAVCHGADGQGRVGATLAQNWPSIRPDLRIKASIENGIAGSPMPAWSQLNGGPLGTEEIDALVAYILNWETGGPRYIPPTPTLGPRPVITSIPNVEGDPNNGATLYDQNCSVCHGPNGEGRVGATLGRVWSAFRVDLELENTITNGIKGSPMPAWGQANGGPLSESQVDDLVAYIMTLPVASTVSLPVQPGTTRTPLSWLSGWGGLIIAVLLFVLVIAVAVLVQSRKPAE